VQLHSDAGPGVPGRLRERLGSELRILRVVHFGTGGAEQIAEQIAQHARNRDVDGVLVDSRTPVAVGGTGVTFDWASAREIFLQNAKARKRLIAAGGLSPENVAEAIATLRPWGVDVASGIEAAPGRKDPHKVREFVTRARAADRE
jgi:phosphoribosylanthranilate isomerase